MTTQITNKQVKIVSNVDFNEKEIENAVIDANKNNITNLDMPTKVSELENDSGYTTTADVNSEIIANSSFMDSELQEGSFNAVTNDAITKGIEKNKVSVVDRFVDTLPSETLTLGQSVLNITDNKIYKVVGEKQIEDYFFKINGSLSINNDDGCITGFSEENYISLADDVIEYTNPVWSNIKVNKLIFTLAPASTSYTTTIFSIIRRDDNSVLFGVDYTSGYGGRLNIYTKKRDGTNVDSYTIYAAVTNSRYELEITNSCYIKIVDRGKTIAIKYFGSLEPSTEVGDDFYYNIPADIKISSKKITSQQYTYTVGIQNLYGLESRITYESGGMPSGGNIVYPSDTGVWNNGTELFSGKLVYNIANYGLYEYNGTNMVSLIPDMKPYQKKLAAGNNITISPEGYQNFSNSNYLSFNSTVDSTYSDDFFFKVTINETNRLNTLLYSVFDTNKYGYIEITDENKLNCVWISGSSEMTFIGANYVFQPNKTYWIRLVQNRVPQQFYILEDNNYTIETVPKALSAWTYDARGLSHNLVVKLYANSTNYLGYNPTATANYFKGTIEEFSVGNIFTLSTAVAGTDFTNIGCIKGPVISAIIPEIDSQLSDISENPVQNKVIDAALKSMQPVVVTSSGDSLPATTGFIEGNTFLNTIDKKIYKAEMTIESYELNTDVTNEGITVDLQTGVASGFVPAGGGVYTPKGIRHNNLNILWKEPITLNFHFNITETRDNQVIATLYQGGYGYKCVSFYIANDNKIYLTYTQGNGGSSTQSNIFLLADYQLLLNTEYFVEINKNGTNVTTTISTQGYNISPEYEETINNVEDWYPSDNYSYLIYGYYNMGPLSGGQSVFSGSIYLADSFGEFLLPVRTVSWDSGTSLENDKTYLDITNDLLYFYKNDKLTAIGNSLPSQEGNNGKFLTTNGSTMSWSTVTTYQNFNSSWVTNTTFTDFMDSIRDDASAIAGMAYLGELTCSGLPINGNVEAVVEIQNGPSNHKTIHTTITSGTNAPYRWEYTYWNNGSNTSGWIGFQPELPSQSGNNGKFLTTNGSTMSWATVSSGTSDYSSLSNKPSINNVELTGNISLSSLGIQSQNLSFTNKTVSTSDWTASVEYSGYSYECTIPCTGVTANSYAQVIFNPTEASSGNYATVCKTGSGTVTIYSKVNTAITIPTIIVMGA